MPVNKTAITEEFRNCLEP